MGTRLVYEVRIGGVLVCRGDVYRAADALCVVPSTIRQYKYSGRGPSYVSVETISPRYRIENDDGDVMMGSAIELSKQVGIGVSRFYYAHVHGQRIGGYKIRKIGHTEFSLPAEQIENLIRRCKVIARKMKQAE